MYKYILESTANINWLALFALITFFFIFSLSVFLIFLKDKKSLKHLEELPLSDGETSNLNK